MGDDLKQFSSNSRRVLPMRLIFDNIYQMRFINSTTSCEPAPKFSILLTHASRQVDQQHKTLLAQQQDRRKPTRHQTILGSKHQRKVYKSIKGQYTPPLTALKRDDNTSATHPADMDELLRRKWGQVYLRMLSPSSGTLLSIPDSPSKPRSSLSLISQVRTFVMQLPRRAAPVPD